MITIHENTNGSIGSNDGMNENEWYMDDDSNRVHPTTESVEYTQLPQVQQTVHRREIFTSFEKKNELRQRKNQNKAMNDEAKTSITSFENETNQSTETCGTFLYPTQSISNSNNYETNVNRGSSPSPSYDIQHVELDNSTSGKYDQSSYTVPISFIPIPNPDDLDDKPKSAYSHHGQQQQQQHPQEPIFRSNLYKYSQDSITGRALTKISHIFLERKLGNTNSPPSIPTTTPTQTLPQNQTNSHDSQPPTTSTATPNATSSSMLRQDEPRAGAALAGFLSNLSLTCATYMLSPMRDAAALAVGVSHIPLLTLISTLLALGSSVPVGWLFEAPNPERRGRRWRGKIGLTRGDTQGTSLALFYRCFAIILIGYSITFKAFELLDWNISEGVEEEDDLLTVLQTGGIIRLILILIQKFGKFFYVAFFLVVHLMKLHSTSLLWGVTSEALEYEEQAELRLKKRMAKLKKGESENSLNGLLSLSAEQQSQQDVDTAGHASSGGGGKRSRVRLRRLAFVGFGGTLGGILGSVIVSMTAHIFRLSGLLVVAAILLGISAELSTELGQIMLRHWEEEQIELNSNDDLVSLAGSSSGVSHGTRTRSSSNSDTCMKRIGSSGGLKRVISRDAMNPTNTVDSSMKKVASMGTMKRIASGNSINNNLNDAQRSRSAHARLDELAQNNKTAQDSDNARDKVEKTDDSNKVQSDSHEPQCVDDNTFKQRLLRGITTILRSRLLMTIFTYNALYATTTVLLSFQRAELVANRKSSSSTSKSVDSDTAFLANINIASSVAVFVLQASGLGAMIASSCGQRGTLSLMPLVRLFGVGVLAFLHIKSEGGPPNLLLFLVLDEFTKIINFAVAKPVRESLWRGLSNEARYEAKPIVDTLANRWGGGSAAFLMSLLDRIMNFTGLGEVAPDGTKTLFGFPPLLILCSFSAVWWTMVSADLGNIRHRIDLELKKQQ